MIELQQNFRSRESVLTSVNDVFYQIMTKNLGGITYTPETALYPGAKFEEVSGKTVLDPEADAVDTVAFLNREVFGMIDNSVSMELLARLLSSQLVTRGEKHLLDRSRTYFKLLYQIIRTGQGRGQLRTDMTANEIVKAYAMFERGLMYDWCLSGGEYALSRYSALMMPMFLQGFRAAE